MRSNLLCRSQAERANLIEKKGAVMGRFDAAFLGGGGAGESAFLIPKKFRLHQGFRQRGAIHADESPVATRALVMDRPRHQLFSRPAFPADSHRGIAARHPLDGLKKIPHGIRRAQQITHLRLARDFLAQQAVFALDANLFDRSPDYHS